MKKEIENSIGLNDKKMLASESTSNCFEKGFLQGCSATLWRGGQPFSKSATPTDHAVSDHTFPEKVWTIFSSITMSGMAQFVETRTI